MYTKLEHLMLPAVEISTCGESIIKMMHRVFGRCITRTIEKGMLLQLLFAILWPGFEGKQGIINPYYDNQMKSIINTVRHLHLLHLSLSLPTLLTTPSLLYPQNKQSFLQNLKTLTGI